MRNSDFIFFGVMFIGVILVFISIIFGVEIPSNSALWLIGILLPFAIVKQFLPKSKFGKWLNKYN